MLPVSLRRAARPFKLQVVALLVTATFTFGGVKRSGLLRSTAAIGDTDAKQGRRRLNEHGGDLRFSQLTLIAQEPDEEPQLPRPRTAEAVPSTAEAALNAFGLIYMFLALAIVCDEFFVPALDVITKKLNLSPDVAGATFMAAGGSAPEFFTAVAGSFSQPPSDVGIAAIVGSAVFNVLFVIGACGIFAKGTLQLTAYPLARDSAFYVVHLLLLCVWFRDGVVHWWESLIQFVMYIIYCVFMGYSQRFEDMWKKRYQGTADDGAVDQKCTASVKHNETELQAVDQKQLDPVSKQETEMTDLDMFDKLDDNNDGHISKEEALNGTLTEAEFHELDLNKDGKIDRREFKVALRSRRALLHIVRIQTGLPPDDNEPATIMPPKNRTCRAYFYWVVSLPIILLLMLTIPDVRRKSGSTPSCWQNLYPVTFILSILWIAVFSFVMVQCSVVVGEWTQIDQRILALTLIASGTSVPDLLTSVFVTLQGHGDMAISSSIGSNIFDVTVGLPVPWLLYSIIYSGASVPVESKPLTMWVQIGSLIGMLVAVVMSIRYNGWVLNKTLGYIMLVLYVGFMYLSIQQVLAEDA